MLLHSFLLLLMNDYGFVVFLIGRARGSDSEGK